jgi:methionyl-tRNA formyltransferase
MLPGLVYEIPPKGAFNVHASLLPQYRGAAPIHWAIMNGETQTGVTTFFLNQKIDCGDLILQRKTDILPNETTGELYDRLKIMGAELALETLFLIEKGDFKPLPQPHETANLKVAPKIQKEDTIIDWNDTAKNIINKIRGLSPNPGACTFFTKNDKEKLFVKIFDATILLEKSHHRAGVITTDDNTFLHISTKDFQISIDNLQVEGKKRVNPSVFLRGNKASIYTILFH